MIKPELSKGDIPARGATVLTARTEGAAPRAAANDSADSRNIFSFLKAKNPKSPMPLNMLGKPLPAKDLIALHYAIETALPEKPCRIVQFAGCGTREGTTKIALQLARFSSGTLGHRVLFIDIEPAGSPLGNVYRKTTPSLLEAGNLHALAATAIARATVNGLPFDYAYLTAEPAVGAILPHHEKIRQILSVLREQYALIVFHTSTILTNPLGVTLGRLAHGTILVIEAEHTRAPAARQAISLLKEKGVEVAGLVFNKRRHYIPDWAYRWL